ncbi:MAG: TetR/AcrR family transcriptional regulator [Alphaproteobacteria bacterium]|jgi:AcrR family transcriptional regulator|nr:MAG: TetR/AcrR family transcriptional regulator [Alphaproteobacteria bacterium]
MQVVPESAVSVSPRERILAAARKIFLDGLPEHATMDAVAQQAGMSKKTIYREFKSQVELLGALLMENVADMGEFPGPKLGDDIEIELYGMLVRMVGHFTSPRSMALFRLIVSEVRRYPELMSATKPKGFPRELLADWLASPIVREKYTIEDPDDAAAMLFGMVMQDSGFKLMVVSTSVMPQHVIEARARRAVQIFLRGVRKGG